MNTAIHSKRLLFFFFIASIAIIFYQCEKEKEVPSFGSMDLQAISNSAFFATVDVRSLGDYSIIDHGFVYTVSTADPGLSFMGTKKSLGDIIENDTFSAVLLPDLRGYYYLDGLKCYARAYITDERGTMYSDYVTASVLKLNALTISPSSAKPGDTITISGSNFHTEVSQNSVTFNNTAGIIASVTPNEIKVIVPSGIHFEYYWSTSVVVRLISGSQTCEFNSVFRLKPFPSSFSPSSGTWNNIITIYGSGLQNCTVFLDTREISLADNNFNSAYFYLPQDLMSKKFKIYIKSEGELFEVPGGYFTMNDLDLTLTQKTRYYPGESIIVNGTGFNPTEQYNKLFLGQNEIDCMYAYSNLTFEVPLNIPSGDYSVKVSNTIDTVSFDGSISVIRPVMTDISSTSGFPGSEVTITGTDLTNESFDPSINFGEYSFYASQVNTSQIVFKVPMIPPGEYSVYGWYSVFAVEAPGKFTVLEPVVNSIEPSVGSPGTSVVISGQGFGESYYNSVYFGNVYAPIMSQTDTEINVRVPDSLSAGNWMVQVSLNGIRLSTTVNFQVQ
jgi:hypothetical protein